MDSQTQSTKPQEQSSLVFQGLGCRLGLAPENSWPIQAERGEGVRL